MALLSRLGRRLLTLAVVLGAFAVPVATRPAAAAPASQEPAAYIVVDAGTGRVLVGKKVHEPRLTASTVKLLTALVALERLPLTATVPVSPRAESQPASKISMRVGQVWKLNDALHALLMESANDAAFAIAERASGTIEQFAKDAQEVAERLGTKDTAFADPAGLDDEQSFGGTQMSAYDLAVVARNALAVPTIADPARKLSYALTDPSGIAREFRNHNEGFLRSYPGATGLKTGHTDNAGRTLVTSATRDGRTLVAVVLNTWDDTGWSGFLLDQGFTMPADAPGTGETIPKVRTVTADQRRAALTGLPYALGAAGPSGAAAAAPATPPTTARAEPTRQAARDDAREPAPAGSDGGQLAAATAPAESTGSGVDVGTFLNWRVLALVLFVVLVTLFLLRRRAVKRQRKRRLERQRRMAEIRRRRMIDVVEPGDSVGHVRVVTARPARTRAM